jgi:hypothetical protein
MAIKDVLLTLTSYPEPTPVSVIEDAVSFASSLGVHIATVACEARVEIPGTFLSSSLVDVAGIAAGEARKSLKNVTISPGAVTGHAAASGGTPADVIENRVHFSTARKAGLDRRVGLSQKDAIGVSMFDCRR